MLDEFKSQGLSCRQFAITLGFAISTTHQVLAGSYPNMDSPLASEILAAAKGYLYPEQFGF